MLFRLLIHYPVMCTLRLEINLVCMNRIKEFSQRVSRVISLNLLITKKENTDGAIDRYSMFMENNGSRISRAQGHVACRGVI